MPTTFDRPEFAPPEARGFLRALLLAIAAHALLIVALTYGLKWKNDTGMLSVEAELWSATPQEAPPPEVPAPPPPQPVVRAPPLPDPQVQRDAEIALQRDKERREAAERRQEELERERDRKRKLEAEKKREEERERKEQLAKAAAAEKRKLEEAKRKQQEQDAKKMAQLREENLKRMQGMAGGSGAPSSTGTAAKSSGPSDSWAGRIRARVKPNIVFADDVAGNPAAEVEVRLAPDGTIVGKRLVKSSGAKAWDEAVLRALDKTEMLPRDVDGRVHSPVVIAFRPKG